jgi:hypothetical protein
MMKHRDFTEKLVSEIPVLVPLLEEHKLDNGELLPHVFFGDLTRYVSSLHKDSIKGNRNAEENLKRVLSALEAGMVSGIKEVEELIAVSFLENLDWGDPDFQHLKGIFGPNLKKELKNIGGE